jgi:hypothetical protein
MEVGNMTWYVVLLAVILFLFYLLSGSLFSGSKLTTPLFKAGPVQIDPRDIIALGIVFLAWWFVHTGRITAKEALVILASIIGGRALGSP